MSEYIVEYELWKIGGHAPLMTRTMTIQADSEESAEKELELLAERASQRGYMKQQWGPYMGKLVKETNHKMVNPTNPDAVSRE